MVDLLHPLGWYLKEFISNVTKSLSYSLFWLCWQSRYVRSQAVSSIRRWHCYKLRMEGGYCLFLTNDVRPILQIRCKIDQQSLFLVRPHPYLQSLCLPSDLSMLSQKLKFLFFPHRKKSINQFFDHRILEMRQFLSQQKKSGHLSRSQPSSTISFDSFIFQDNLTNSKIVIKDAHKKYHNKEKMRKWKRSSNRSQGENLNQCIKSLKTTKLFQMDSLRTRLFKTSMHTRNPTFEDERQALNQTSQGLRQLIHISMTENSLNELRQCINNPKQRGIPQTTLVQTMKDCNPTKNNLSNLMGGSQKKQTVINSYHFSKIHQQVKVNALQDEQQLQEKVQHYIASLRNKNSFLVFPDRQHQLYQKLYTACNNKKNTIKKKKISKTHATEGEQGIFKPIDLGHKVIDLQRKVCQKENIRLQTDEQRQILYAVENNLFFDLQFLINSRKSLINTRDKMGNNLLHIAAKNRNDSLFLFILKHIGPQALESKNNLGKTPKEIAKMYGVKQILSLIDSYSPYEYHQSLLTI